MSIAEEKYIKSNLEDSNLISAIRGLGNPVSTLMLHSPCSIFRTPHIEGLIGYQVFKNSAVVLGDPVCSLKNRPELTRAFHDYCKGANLSIVYLLTSKSFADWAINNGCRISIQVGELVILNPTTFQKTQKLRWKINQAIHHGVEVQEYVTDDGEIEKEMQAINDQWLSSRRGGQLHLGAITFPLDRTNERIFYATHKGKIIGLLQLSPIDVFHGWVVVSYFAIQNSPVGTTEHLLGSAFDTLANENCHYLCMGATAGRKLGDVIGTSRISYAVAQIIYKCATWMFRLSSKKNYLDKFHPHFQPTYCLFSGKMNVHDLLAVKHLLDAKL